MPATKTYDYQGLDAAGSKSKGKVDAVNDTAAIQAVRALGVTPLQIDESGRGLQRDLKLPGFGGKVKTKDLAVFARQFATMSSSGLFLIRALSILEDQATNRALRDAIKEMRTDVEGGGELSSAMARHPKIFPSIAVSLIRAGEAGGFLDDALDRVATTFEKEAGLRAKIKSAMTYPVIVVFFSMLMIGAVLLFIVPIFEKMFAQLGGALPLPTQVIVNVSHALVWLVPLLFGLTAFAVTAMRRAIDTNPKVRLRVHRLKLRIPVFGPLFTKIAISRFALNLGTLLSVGVPVLQSLQIVGETTGNAVIENAMSDVAEAVRTGNSMTKPLYDNTFFPPMVTQMIEVGEESGALPEMLSKVSEFYDREVEAATEALTAAIEPIMVVFMGAIVGGMVICLYMPMFSIYSHIQGTS